MGGRREGGRKGGGWMRRERGIKGYSCEASGLT